MPCYYYFQVTNGACSFGEDIGEVHVSVEAAEAKARQIARELAEEPNAYTGYNVVVTDLNGNTVASVAIVAR
jgi:hypothetical protein